MKPDKNKTVIVIAVLIAAILIIGTVFYFKYNKGARQPVSGIKAGISASKRGLETARYRRFKKFWHGMYKKLRAEKVVYTLKPLYNDKINKIETYDLTLASYDGLRLKGYFSVPYGAKGKKYPGVLLLHGYGSYGTPGWAHFFAVRGYAALSIDLRGHGRSRVVYNPGFPGLMTDGILHLKTFSMVKIVMDSLASLRFLEHYKNINSRYIFVTGGSMGGGLPLIDAAIDRHIVAAAGDVPFLSDIPVQMPLAKMGPYMEVKALLKKHPGDKAKVMRSLYYVDTMHFARRIKAPVLIGVGLEDEDCPPKGTFAAYKLIKAKKLLFIAKHSGHVVLPGWNMEVFKFFAPYMPKSMTEPAKTGNGENGRKKSDTKNERNIL